ncbi:dipeptidyl peptidase 3 [Pendulispora brunnea]|uniref:Dipeptidyl peptidase 3 n=1 Tax=Pendulispora brunnea TaxID=2905690 RepID=A0ABZ2K5I0_9BACT
MRLLAAASLVALVACSPASAPPPAPAPRVSEVPHAAAQAPKAPTSKSLGMVGDIQVASYPPSGFERLSAEQRALAYHLASAALAGDVIFTMQTSRFAWPARQAVQRILAKRDKLEPGTRDKLLEYRRFLFVHHGLHDKSTGAKYTPPIARAEFEKAARAADVSVPAELLAAMFDPKVQPAQVNKSPGVGKDPIAESASNHYEGITSKDLHLYEEQYELNGRLVKQGGKVVEQVYRSGDAKTPAGLAAPELKRVIEHLQAASALAPAAQKEALRHLVNYLATGTPEEFRKHDIAWVAQTFPVDYILGFIEVALDVRQRKGSFEAFVAIADPLHDPPLQALAREAAYFEQKLPTPKEYKRDVFRVPAAAAVSVLAATGEAGFFTFGGVNLPNSQEMRETHGSKNFINESSLTVFRELRDAKLLDEFVAAESRAEVQRCLPYLVDAAVGFHEVTGHGSGKVSSTLQGDPSKLLAPYYSAMEEGRANLVANYLIGDPKTVQIGLLPDAACARVYPSLEEAMTLEFLSWVPEGDRIEEDHMQGAFIRLGIFLEKGVTKVEERNGKIFFTVKDPDAWRRAAGELLTEHQRIKATGDKAAMAALVEKYGSRLNTTWRDQVIARVKSLNLPRALATVPPVLTPIRDAKGQVIDAKAEQVTSLDAYLDVLEGS